MHNHTFRKIDAARLCETALGLSAGSIVSIDADNDGQVDGTVVIMHTDDFGDLAGDPADADYVYFGDFVIEGYDSSSVTVRFNVDGIITLAIDQGSGLLPIGNILPCIIWDEVKLFSGISAHFYGWKFPKP